MEERDVVQGLFEDKIAEACADSVRSALLLEDQNRWKPALEKYKDCIENGSSVENFLYEACFKVIKIIYSCKYNNFLDILKLH